jgi:broad specificity phosphatase PhoE
MEIIFIRHGEPNYTPCDERGFIGHGRALAPLTELGIVQAEKVALNSILSKSEMIVSSPYPRALQTAAIISRETGIKLIVEMDLREWEPDKTFQFKSSDEADALYQDFCNCKGIYPKGEKRNWEEIDEIIDRINPVIHFYYKEGYEKVIVVAHGGIIRRFTGEAKVQYCKPYIINYCGSFDYYKWID